MIKHLEAVEAGKVKRLAVFMPPGHAKSTYCSVIFPSWFMGRHPRAKLIACSNTMDLAETFGRRVRNVVASMEFFHTFDMTLSIETKAAGHWMTTGGGEYLAAGVGGTITGRRADGAVIDDPIRGREDADSETIRRKQWNWYLADLRTRLKPNAWVILIQTRWHEEDLAGMILEHDADQWTILNLPAIAEADDALGRPIGEPLWPEWFGHEYYRTEQRVQPARNWAALFQQRPAPEEGDYFSKDWLRWYRLAERPKHLRVYGASDYAVTADGGDYTVHVVVGIDAAHNIYVLDLWRAQTDSMEWIEALLDLATQWKPIGWAEEAGQIIKSVGPFIDRRMQERKTFLAREQFVSSNDKPTRAQSFRARMSMGKVYFAEDAPWCETLVSELLHFPTGKHDDMIDALSLIGRVLDKMAPATVPAKAQKPKFDLDQTVAEVFAMHDEMYELRNGD